MKKLVFVLVSMACLYALGIRVHRVHRHVPMRHRYMCVKHHHQQLVPVKRHPHHSPAYHRWYHHSFWGPYGSYFWPGFVGGLVVGNAFKPVATTPVVVQQPVVIGPVATNSVIMTQQPIIIR